MSRMRTLTGNIVRDGQPVRAVVTAVARGQRYDAWTQDSNIPGRNRPGVFALEVPDHVDEVYVTELAPMALDVKGAPVVYLGGNRWSCSLGDVIQLSSVLPNETVVLTLLPDRRTIRVARTTSTAQGPQAFFAFGRQSLVA
jgi:hypothetical protein